MRITVKGQVTIPNEFRQKFGLLPHTEVEFKEINGMLCIVKAKHKKRESRGEKIIKRMRSTKTNSMTTDEILALTREYNKEE